MTLDEIAAETADEISNNIGAESSISEKNDFRLIIRHALLAYGEVVESKWKAAAKC